MALSPRTLRVSAPPIFLSRAEERVLYTLIISLSVWSLSNQSLFLCSLATLLSLSPSLSVLCFSSFFFNALGPLPDADSAWLDLTLTNAPRRSASLPPKVPIYREKREKREG